MIGKTNAASAGPEEMSVMTRYLNTVKPENWTVAANSSADLLEIRKTDGIILMMPVVKILGNTSYTQFEQEAISLKISGGLLTIYCYRNNYGGMWTHTIESVAWIKQN